jgi:Xaa-Pro aminopeptidase
MNDVQSETERVGVHYDRSQMLAVRRMTLEALRRIASAVQPGMAEEQAVAEGRSILKEMGLLRGWHGIKVRFGANTLKVFSEPSEPGVILQEDDIFFVDIGPVWRSWEDAAL